jgi:hypothetical protein
MKLLSLLSRLYLLISLFSVSLLHAEKTPISISVLSNDAKFIGSSFGGMQITIRDLGSDELLASGLTRGSTGDTSLIMKQPQPRDTVLRTEGSARFDVELDLDRPTRVRIEATGPLAQMQSVATVSETWTLLPGKDYSQGNGILLTLHGLVVDALTPPAHIKLKHADVQALEVTANVTKMCGCPIGEDTPWSVDRYQVEARIYQAAGELVEVLPMTFSGQHSQFKAVVQLADLGAYEIIVIAFDPNSKDSGADSTTVNVTGK